MAQPTHQQVTHIFAADDPAWGQMDDAINAIFAPYQEGIFTGVLSEAVQQTLHALSTEHPSVCMALGHVLKSEPLIEYGRNEHANRHVWRGAYEGYLTMALMLHATFSLAKKEQPNRSISRGAIDTIIQFGLVGPVIQVVNVAGPPDASTRDDLEQWGHRVLAACVAAIAGIAHGRTIAVNISIHRPTIREVHPFLLRPHGKFDKLLHLFECAHRTLSSDAQAIIEKHYVQFDDSRALTEPSAIHHQSLSELNTALQQLAWS